MPAFVKNLTFDCVDALRVARFWAAALGSDVDEGSTSVPSPPWPRKSTAWSPSAPPWSSATTTSPPCTTRKATSSASSRVPATPQASGR